MATDAQIKANRLNATLSTGPTSELGKKTAAANSAKRGGISGKGKALAPELWNQVVAAKFVLTQGNSPADEYDKLLIEDAALARVLWLECEDQLIALREHQADLAQINWQDLRELEAGALAQQLARHPHATVRKLRQTPQGCAYLIDLWRVAEVDLRKQGILTDATRDQIWNLLGVTAAVRRAGLAERLTMLRDAALTALRLIPGLPGDLPIRARADHLGRKLRKALRFMGALS